jgi:ribosomal protein S18 acetylase RimI-like enzyme
VTTSPTVVVRRATPHDAGDIVRLALEVQDVHVARHPELFKPGGVEPRAEIASRVITPGQFYWVATLAGDPVGYAYARLVIEPESLWRYASRVLLLDQMGVDARHRSRGIGEALWGAVRETAAAEAVDRVVLNVWSFNRDARRFYEELGFKPLQERMAFEIEPPGHRSG